LKEENEGIQEEKMLLGRHMHLSNEVKNNSASFRRAFNRMGPDAPEVEKNQHNVPEPQRPTWVNISWL